MHGITVYLSFYFTDKAGMHLVHGEEGGRVAKADDTAGKTRASVASLLRVSVVAAAEVVDASVEDDTAAQDRAGAAEAELAVGDVEDDGAVLVGDDVAEVSGVADLVLGRAVGLVVGVEVAAGSEAALARDVAELVNVETVGRRRLEARNLTVSTLAWRSHEIMAAPRSVCLAPSLMAAVRVWGSAAPHD